MEEQASHGSRPSGDRPSRLAVSPAALLPVATLVAPIVAAPAGFAVMGLIDGQPWAFLVAPLMFLTFAGPAFYVFALIPTFVAGLILFGIADRWSRFRQLRYWAGAGLAGGLLIGAFMGAGILTIGAAAAGTASAIVYRLIIAPCWVWDRT